MLCADRVCQRGEGRQCSDTVPAEFAPLGGVYVACQVDRQAVPENTRSGPPAGFVPTKSCAMVIMEFVVDASGRPVTDPIRVIRSNDERLVEAMRADLPSKRYKPAMKDGVPVSQVARTEFGYGVVIQGSSVPTSVARSSVPKC